MSTLLYSNIVCYLMTFDLLSCRRKTLTRYWIFCWPSPKRGSDRFKLNCQGCGTGGFQSSSETTPAFPRKHHVLGPYSVHTRSILGPYSVHTRSIRPPASCQVPVPERSGTEQHCGREAGAQPARGNEADEGGAAPSGGGRREADA